MMNILLADDLIRVRFALRVLLEQQPGWKVVGEAANAEEMLDQAKNSCPDLVLLDGDLPDLDSDERLRSLRQTCPQVRIVTLTEQQPLPSNHPAAGSDAFASRAYPPERLLGVIRCCFQPALSA